MRCSFPILALALICVAASSGQIAAQTRGEASAATEADIGQKKPDTVGSGGEYREEFPIDLPSFRDLPPELRLTYSSSNTARGGTDNFIAFGWRLSGLSTIERQTVGGGVPMFDDGQDLYVVDGQQLMACADTAATAPWGGIYPLRYRTTAASASCSAGGNFTARIEDYRRYYFDSASNVWTVTDPAGRRSVYKPVSAFAGAYNLQDQADVRQLTRTRWVLAEITDTQKDAAGQYTNKVTISWLVGAATDGRPVVPASLSYAGYEVAFNYQTKSSPVAFFGTGTANLGRLPYQLRSVTIREGSAPIRAYNLVLTTTTLTGTRLLNRIESYGSDYVYDAGQSLVTSGTKLPDTSYSYTPEQVAFDTRTYSGANFAGGTLAFDDDHDGRDDLFTFGGTTYWLRKTGGSGSGGGDEIWTYAATYPNRRFGFDGARAIAVKAGVENPCPPEQAVLNLDGSVVRVRTY